MTTWTRCCYWFAVDAGDQDWMANWQLDVAYFVAMGSTCLPGIGLGWGMLGEVASVLQRLSIGMHNNVVFGQTNWGDRWCCIWLPSGHDVVLDLQLSKTSSLKGKKVCQSCTTFSWVKPQQIYVSFPNLCRSKKRLEEYSFQFNIRIQIFMVVWHKGYGHNHATMECSWTNK